MTNTFFKKKSSIHGVGVFTNKSFVKGAIIYQIPQNTFFNNPKSRCAHIKGRWVSDEEVLNYINHSCNPNTRLDISKDPCLIALRDIGKDEEITVNYDETEQGGTKVSCNCQGHCKGYFLRLE